ncbi:hypothetical protein ES319_A13G178500v1, partial [Gossypium barbadense]
HNGRVRVPFFDYLNSAPSIDVLQSCYGLFFCKSEVGNLKNVISRYFICNPRLNIKFYVNMAFDPLKSPFYKVICVRESDSWTLSRISFSVKNNIQFLDAVFRNGKIHWNCYWEDSFYFDAENEPLTMPISTMEAPQMCSYMGECRGVLYVSVTSLSLRVENLMVDVSYFDFFKFS